LVAIRDVAELYRDESGGFEKLRNVRLGDAAISGHDSTQRLVGFA
jgi:hypothetical protein